MAGVENRNPEAADDVRTPKNATLQMLKVGGKAVGKATFQPGWRWSESIKPVVGTDDCEMHHLGYMVAGTLHVVHADGTEADIHAGDFYNVQPHHDAWVVGEEVVEAVEFDPTTASTFAADD